MGLKRNTIANYVGEGYAALIGIVVMPLYLKYLGAEAFGLVGFFVVLQAWLYLLDMGLSPTLARQVAFSKAIRNGLKEIGKLLRSFEIIFIIFAAAIAIGVAIASDGIAHQWIDSRTIAKETIAYCISLMGIIVALRLFSSLYRSGIRGIEDQVWLNVANILITSVRFIGAFIVMRFISSDVEFFFHYQIVVGFLEVIVLGSRFYGKLSLNPLRLEISIHWSSLRSIAPFALSVAYTAGLWIVISQSDKLILSGILPLEQFGYFSLVNVMAGGILVITGPITQAILPRMTSLLATGRQEDMLQIYRNASQIVAVIAVSVALVVGFYSEALIYAWTGDRLAAEWGAEVLLWYALGNGFLALSAFQYHLQNSFGHLKLHVIGSTLSAICQVPIIYYAASNFGAIGAGIAWLSIRSIWFVIWTPIVHTRFVPGLHAVWISKDLLPVIVAGAATITILANYVSIDLTRNRILIAGILVTVGLIEFVAAAIGSKYIRSNVYDFLSKRFVVS